MTPTTTTYPLTFEPIFKPKVWGGRALERFGKALPPEAEGLATFGESWELADLGATSPSGGGGGAARSVIANGPMAGKTLHDAMEEWGGDLLGDAAPSAEGGFPLLVKYLDAREHLSVQCHPSPAYAAAHPGASLKTESWVVLHAEPGAELFLGVTPGTSADELRARIDAGTLPDVLVRVPAEVGACYTLPTGTVHALGAGIVVAEIQTPSDTTFRLYDWTAEYDRPERETHVEEALAACVLDEPPAPGRTDGPRGVVAQTEHFTIERAIASCEEVSLPKSGCCVVMVTKTMGASIASDAEAFEEVEVRAGATILVPAACAGDAVLRAGPMTEVLVVTIG